MKTKRFFGRLCLTIILTIVSFSNILLAQTAQDIIDDMTLAPDAALHGTEGLSWGSGFAVIDAGGQVPRQNFKGQYFHSLTEWGQCYIARDGSPANNVRVQIRNIVTKILQKDGTWVILQQGQPDGAAFVENFAGNAAVGADWRDESANGGGRSATCGIKGYAGHNLHFWPTGPRGAIDTANIVGAFSTYDARLIVDDPNLPDDRNICRTTAQNGSDWWLDQNIGWLPDWSANSGCAGSRAKFLNNNWQTFNMCTMPASWIRANPPVGTRPPLVSVSSVSISPSTLSINIGLSQLLTATVLPVNATNQAVTWSTSNPSVVRVNLTGNIYTVSPGSAVISATSYDGNKIGSVTVTVIDGFAIPARIEAENYTNMSGVTTEPCLEGTQDVASNDAGDWLDYRIAVPSSGTYTLDLRLSSPIATGQIQILTGSTVLTTVNVPNSGGWQNWATTTSPSFNLNAGSQTIRLNVISGGYNLNWIEFKGGGAVVLVSGMSVSPATASISVGSTTTLIATVLPTNASNKTVNWTSSNTAIATVNSSGVITGVAAGTATITATSTDGTNKTGSSTVTVTALSTYPSILTKLEAESYVSMNNIQTEACSEGGLDVGYTAAGSYMNYNVNVPSAGNYNVVCRVASGATSGGTFLIKNGATVLATVTVNGGTNWQGWYSTPVSANFALPAGNITIQVLASTGGWNINWLQFAAASSNILVTSVSVSPATATVAAGSTTSLSATVAPGNATNAALTWTSSNTAIATVNASGLVTGVAAGTATITATSTDGTNKSGASTVTVTPLSTYPSILTKLEAESYVSMFGIQTENCTEGGLDIGWTDAGDYMNYNVNVSTAGTYTVDCRVASGSGGGSFQIKSGTTVLTTINVPASGGWQNWTTVTSGSFNLSAGNQTLQVYATSNGWNLNWLQFTTSSNVAVTGVTASPTSAFVAVGSTNQLTATVAPSNATNQNVSWASSNTGIAKVSSTGLVSGVAAGSATITVTTQDGGKTATSAITVTSPVTTKYEAEDASLSGGAKKNTDHTGYSGTGFVDGYGTQGATTTFTVNASSAGSYNITLRYANNRGSDMTISIYFNGIKIRQTSLPNLSNWDTWSDKVETLTLTSGNNTIAYKFDAGDSGNVNLDFITISGGTLKSALAGETATDIKQPKLNIQLMVYPNPSTDGSLNIRLDGQTDDVLIQIYSITGKIEYTSTLLKGETKHVTGLSTGNHLIKVVGNNINEVRKIVTK